MSSVFAIDMIANDIAAEFTAKNITAKVLIGEWEVHKHDASARVILGLGRGESLPFGQNPNRWGPGVQAIATGPTTKARPLWACMQTIIVWVSSPPDNTVPPDQRDKVARALTWNLANQTLRAMWHSHGGWFPWGALEWQHEAQANRLYGAALKLEAVLPVPVLDDDMVFGTATEADGDGQLELEDGTQHDDGTTNQP